MDLIFDCQNRIDHEEICSKRNKIRNFENLQAARCRKCGYERELFLSESLKQNKILDACSVCQKSDFYIQRDFPQQAGCLVVLVGACLVPWTYGLSLAAVALVDFILYKTLPNIAVCYHCLSRVRGALPNSKHKPFDHNLFEYFLKEDEKKAGEVGTVREKA